MRHKFFKFFYLPFFAVVGFLLAIAPAKAYDIFISEDTTWSSGETIIINGETGLAILPGASLTIEPGVVVKLGRDNAIVVQGNLDIAGSADNPVIITSLADDSVGGDTNTDGNATTPAPGDWFGIIVNNGQANVFVDYAQIKYGGTANNFNAGVLNVVQAADVFINHSSIINNNGIMGTASPNFKINNSNIYNSGFCQDLDGLEFCGALFGNGSGVEIDAKGNFWGHLDGPTLNLGEVKGTFVQGAVNFEPFLSDEWFPAPPKPDPVILIPGILGSWNLVGKWELDPILHTYDNLWEALQNAGYVVGQDLFALPYNWRLSNTYTATLLKEKIAEVKEICQCDKVDIIGHSMGGLVARAYIQLLDYENDVDQLIFLATPHLGSTKSYLAWEAGEFGPEFFDNLQENVFILDALSKGFLDVFAYVRNLPIESIRELLPVYNYLREADTQELRQYPNNYPINSFLELINNPTELEKFNNIDVTNIVANNGLNNTIDVLRVVNQEFDNGKWEHGYPQNYDDPAGDHGLEFGSGDITVSTRGNINFLNLVDVNINSSHDDIVTDAQKQVIKELTNIEPDNEVRNSFIEKLLVIRIFSPADFKITSPSGLVLGKDFENNIAINEINGAFYTGFENEIEFAVVPNPEQGEYRVDLEGTGSGEYTLSVSYIDDNQSIDKNFTGNIELSQKQDFVVNYSNENSDNPLSELTPKISTIDDLKNLIKQMALQGKIIKKSEKVLLNNLLHWQKRLETIDKKVSKTKEQIKKWQEKEPKKPKQKDKKLENLEKQLQKLYERREKITQKHFDNFLRNVDNLKNRDKLNNYSYDIIKQALISLKNNL